MTDQNVKSLKKTTSLTSAWWVFVKQAAIGVSLVTAGCTTNPKPETRPTVTDTVPSNPAPTAPDPPQSEPAVQVMELEETVILPAREEARRERVRSLLLEQARREVLKLAGASGGSYGQELSGLQRNLTAYLRRHGTTMHDRVVVLDPAKFEVSLALGYPVPQAVQLLLTAQRAPTDAATIESITSHISVPYTNRFGTATVSQSPMAWMNMQREAPQACVIVPSSDHAVVTGNITGLTGPQQIEFTNRHEGWHCKDSKYNLRHLSRAEVEGLPANLTSALLATNAVAAEVYAVTYRKEALADAGAVGDMIRGGRYGIELIDVISGWRNRSPQDTPHLSTPVLLGLKQRIMEMGLDAFRRLDDKAAEALYIDVTDTFGMTARSLRLNLQLDSGTPEQRRQIADAAATDNDAARAVLLYRFYKNVAAVTPPPPLSAQEQALAGQLRAYNAAQLLEDKAFALGGKITPQTMVAAYGVLQEELRAHTRREPANPLYPAQATKLQESFLWRVQGMDYVAANARRGVDIVAVEPVLRSLHPALSSPAP
ncbi:MAG TPA: hypothetical protein VEF76_02290 [Patescibacteria group bacterium]|nr:hypothetical protein [Patescibacteria group bacterium]